MDIRCTSCNTGMEIDLESLPTDTVKVKCSSCGMLFLVSSDRQAMKMEQDIDSAPEASLDEGGFDGDAKAPRSITLELNADEERTEAVEPPKKRLRDRLAILCISALLAFAAFIFWSPGEVKKEIKPEVAETKKPVRRAVLRPKPIEITRSLPIDIEKEEVLETTPKEGGAEQLAEGMKVASQILEKPKKAILEVLEKAKATAKASLNSLPEIQEKKKEKPKPKISKNIPSKKLPGDIAAEILSEAKNWTPSRARTLRKKLLGELETYPRNPMLSGFLSMIYAYLGQREGNREWIQYAHELSYKIDQEVKGSAFTRLGLAYSFWAAKKPNDLDEMLQNMPKEKGLENHRLFLRAQSFRLLGRQREALEGFLLAEKADLTFFPVRESLAEMYSEAEKYALARPYAAAIWKQEPLDTKVLSLYTKILEAQSSWEEAATVYSQFLARFPKEDSFRLKRGVAYRRARKFSEARRDLERLLAAPKALGEENLNRLYLERGKLSFDQGLYEESIPFFVKARSGLGEHVPTLRYLAGAHYRVGNLDAAIEAYAVAIKKSPKDGAMRQSLGMAQFKNGALKKSELSFRKALSLGHQEAITYYYLALISEKRSDSESAKGHLKMALEIDPSFANAQNLLRRLETK